MLNVILFHETFEYAITINICYCCQLLHLQAKVPFGLTWAIACVVIETFTPIMNNCVLDQYEGYWLLFDTLHVAIVISIQLRIKDNKQTTT